MNEFEKQMNALRLQFKAEQRLITKDAYRTIGRLNIAISKVDSQEAREALRAERERIFEAMRRSHEINHTCYLQQIELIADRQTLHHKANPSARQIRRMLAQLYSVAEAKGRKSLTCHIDNSRRAVITFD